MRRGEKGERKCEGFWNKRRGMKEFEERGEVCEGNDEERMREDGREGVRREE